MSRPTHRLMKRLAEALDGLVDVGAVPPGYEAAIVLANSRDPEAHIFVGGADPRTFAKALDQLVGNPDQVGIVNRDGVVLEL